MHVIGGGDTGGAMTHLLPLLSALQRTGCDVHLLCLGEGGLADAAGRRGLAVTTLPMAGARDPRVLGPLRRVLASGPDGPTGVDRPTGPTAGRGAVGRSWDVIHTHGMRANLPVRLVAAGLRPRPCLFTTVHSDLRLDYGWPPVAAAYSGLDRVTLPLVDRVVAVSDSLRELLVGRGYPADRVITVRSGLETATADAATEKASDSSRGGSAGVPRPPRVGTVARLVAVKDIDLLLEVAGRLRRTVPGVEVVIVGDGPEGARLEERAAGMGLGDTVRFVGRLEGVGAFLEGLDAYMVTSIYEGGVSMSVLEAMAAAVPVVTVAAGGVAEAVVDGETGYVVERAPDREALAAELAARAATLLSDPALRARLGAAGALRVRADFMVEQTAARTLRAYERCLASRGESS